MANCAFKYNKNLFDKATSATLFFSFLFAFLLFFSFSFFSPFIFFLFSLLCSYPSPNLSPFVLNPHQISLSPPLILDIESFTWVKEVTSNTMPDKVRLKVKLGSVRTKTKLGSVRSKTKLREVRSKPWQCISDLHHLRTWRRFFGGDSLREIEGCGSKLWVVR